MEVIMFEPYYIICIILQPDTFYILSFLSTMSCPNACTVTFEDLRKYRLCFYRASIM
jgi:hypothetical protein